MGLFRDSSWGHFRTGDLATGLRPAKPRFNPDFAGGELQSRSGVTGKVPSTREDVGCLVKHRPWEVHLYGDRFAITPS